MTKRTFFMVDSTINSRRQWLDRLKAWRGLSKDSHLLDWLIELGRQEMKRGEPMTATTDRVQQVSRLRELAGNIAANLGNGTAEELVAYALGDEGREDWAIEIPEWFSGHDRKLLVQFVEENLE